MTWFTGLGRGLGFVATEDAKGVELLWGPL